MSGHFEAKGRFYTLKEKAQGLEIKIKDCQNALFRHIENKDLRAIYAQLENFELFMDELSKTNTDLSVLAEQYGFK